MNEWIISIFMILRSWATLCHAGTENCDAMHLQTANAVITFYWLWSFSLWSGQGMYSLTNTDFKSYIHSVSCNSSGKYIGSTNSARYTDRLVRTVRPPAHILLTFTSTAASKCCVGIMQSVVFRPTLFFSVWWARWDLMKSMKLQTYEEKKGFGLVAICWNHEPLANEMHIHVKKTNKQKTKFEGKSIPRLRDMILIPATTCFDQEQFDKTTALKINTISYHSTLWKICGSYWLPDLESTVQILRFILGDALSCLHWSQLHLRLQLFSLV